MTTAAPTMAKPMTARPLPTGSVSVIYAAGGAGVSSLQELSAMKIPAMGRSKSFFKWCVAVRLDGRWCLLELIMGMSWELVGGNEEALRIAGLRVVDDGGI